MRNSEFGLRKYARLRWQSRAVSASPAAYNTGMAKPEKHSRRAFLQGRAAAQALAGKAQELVESATARMELATPPASILHLHASRRAMACEFAVQYHASEGEVSDEIMAAFDLVETLEDQMTIYRDQSEVTDINRQAADGPVLVEAHLFALLELAEKLYRATDGAFDITSSPLSRVWGFLCREGRLPSEEEIGEAMRWVGFHHVKLDAAEQSICFDKPGPEINLNSIGKGYALDRVATFLDERGLTDYLWHGGSSSVLARGRNQADPQQAWTLGLRDPRKPERRLAEFHLRDQALGTAGGATQFFEHEGKLYSHVLDPRTGWTAEGVFTSTVIAPTAAEADALATAFYVMGVEAVAKYCAKHSGIGAVLVCPMADSAEVTLHAFGLKPEAWTRFDRETASESLAVSPRQPT